MAELKSLGTIFPSLLAADENDREGLIEAFPRFSTWFDATFPVLNNNDETEAWLLQHGSTIDSLCASDGGNVSISSGTLSETRTIVNLAKNTLITNNNSLRTGLHALNPSNCFKAKSAPETFERLLKVVSSMYFAVEAKTIK